MAFIPDEAVFKAHKLKPATWRVYCGLCKFRKHEKRRARVKNDKLAAFLSLAIGTVKNSISELKQKRWIEETEQGYKLLVGDFWAVDKKYHAAPEGVSKSQKEPSSNDDESSLIDDTPSLSDDNLSLIGDKKSSNDDESSLIDDDCIYKDRARGSYQPSYQHSFSSHKDQHTHTPAAHDARARSPDSEQAASPRVCVFPLSRFSKSEIWEYADAFGLTGGFVQARWRDGSADFEIEKFFAGELKPKARASPEKTTAEIARAKLEALRAEKAKAVNQNG